MTESGRPNSVTLRFLAAPTDVGHSGSVDAGTVLEWVDKAAYAAAVGWAKSYCVTAYVGNIHFADPVNSGDMVEVEATIVYTGRSSMHIHTVVSSGDPKGGPATMRSQCMVIFVAVGADGKPIPVQQFEPATPAEIEQRDHALARIKVREQIVEAMNRQEYTDAGTAERVTLRFMAAPTDVNWGGKVHGGIVMKWIDEAAYVCASRYCGRDTVAVFSGGVRFYRPLLIGHVVEVEARLVYTGTKGMHIAVHVRSGDPKGRELNLTTYCLTVMVARDDEGNSVPVPAWVPVSEEDKRLHAHARELLEIRGTAPGNRLPNHLLAAAGPAGSAASRTGSEGS
ncbi:MULTISPECIES: acyl-CoA thioesterase [unclassified Arthrobacter]|uniref:acyl-CoA thioesterase n=1 Tax=unclassified Arthrobacter TaxID=235627 RepID=UPI001CC439A1|nr:MULTISPECIES: acyl-CoA thioesterase [unclassified Arthrobacter]MDE8588495.1 hotdog domain-containing protein [Arthrobacter sp. NQ4]BCW80714.1 acyl-CoA thioesterase [Arthrobacter sp. NicSoilC5]